ncbi:MAG TPA: VPLPA-CTERM-specific exosortase XrtD [Steroidobacteraceae bacterium]|nr:VPLPA-CTERM-specific exosortase XrtD [Steroidobacteraceae bacterium]
MTSPVSRRVLVVALNFAPELTGIGKYVGEMVEDLAGSGFEVRVVTAPPYYPEWKIGAGHSGWRWRRERRNGAEVFRCPIYVTPRLNGWRRLLHLASFAMSSLPVIFWQALSWRPELVFVVEPTLGCVPAAWLAGRLVGAKLWLHVQDFEVDAAFGLGLLPRGLLQRIALAAESWLMRRFDRVSSICTRMVDRLAAKGVPAGRLCSLPNWVDARSIQPLPRQNALRAELGLPADQFVLLYSGNMGEKQGLELLVEAARQLRHDDSVVFLMCGDGAARARIQSQAQAQRLANMRFLPLQPRERLAELLSLADLHLLPQRADVEDLVLPSKLTAIMASARPVVATASADSELARVAGHGGLVVPPGDAGAFVHAIRRLLRDAAARQEFGAAARSFAVARWDRQTILGRLGQQMHAAIEQKSATLLSYARRLLMDVAATMARPTEYALSRLQWVTLGVGVVTLALMFRGTFPLIWQHWHREEYSYGYLIPPISLLLLWQRRRRLQQLPFAGSWAGVLLALAGIGVYFVGTIGALALVDAYALVIVLAGFAFAIMGWKAFRIALPPIALLFLMIPIPTFFFNNLSSFLQLVSSKLGVAVIRLFNISVLLEGNVIDLGSYKLQVAEACSGLRYLFPLLALGIIVVSLVRFRMWMRLVLVASTVPITIVMNSFRIGVIGVLVDKFGIAQAEGFLHQFEGWVIFMSCLGILVLETRLLLRLSGDRRPLRDILEIDWPQKRPAAAAVSYRTMHVPLVAVVMAVTLASATTVAMPHQQEFHPPRDWFSGFPLQLGGWRGQRDVMDKQSLATLMLDDYILANYADGHEAPVNFYVAYYGSQHSNASVHSPSSCLPGGGWRILDFTRQEIPSAMGAAPLAVNRAIVEQGDQRQLVYYWFQERGRNITSEYMVKWYLLWDAATRHRTDGALVRLITPLPRNGDTRDADARLLKFSRQVLPILGQYVPG